MFKTKPRSSPLIGIVGVCASGKTTLIRGLQSEGYHCRHIAQEHSYVQTMWQQLTHPDFLIYLIVDYPSTLTRKNLNWTESEYLEQVARLQHAHDHANFIIDTSQQSPEETLALVIAQLNSAGIHPDPQPAL
jgi:molybdopterin-guanine dinucleotide biosynthesis protein